MVWDREIRKIYIVSILVLGCQILGGCGKREDANKAEVWETSVFSWEEEYLMPGAAEEVDAVMDALNCRVIYQEIPDEVEEEIVFGYLAQRKEKGQSVYYLAGKAEWGVETDGEAMLAAVESVLAWNEEAEKNTGFAGVVWDVEPYLLEDWEVNSDYIMEIFVNNCMKAYNVLNRKNLSVIVCIPNFYDVIGMGAQLERLVESGCDAIAVMNYNKTDEAGQIAFEIELAQAYGKGIIHITEMQEPGYHELTEENTYYHDGIEAVYESWNELQENAAYEKLGFSWHYLHPVLELLRKGGNF